MKSFLKSDKIKSIYCIYKDKTDNHENMLISLHWEINGLIYHLSFPQTKKKERNSDTLLFVTDKANCNINYN